MRRLATVVAVLLAMVAAAGAGALIAAHSTARDQPGIGGAGGQSSSPSRSPEPQVERWHGVMESHTSRAYRSGGTCTTDWRAALHFEVDGSGAISGDGSAKLTSGPSCPFVTGQPQIHGYDLRLAGSLTGGRMQLEVSVVRPPKGSGIDYGGFGAVFADTSRKIQLHVQASGGRSSASAHPVFRAFAPDPSVVSLARNRVRLGTAG
jgi:hypothetical protein